MAKKAIDEWSLGYQITKMTCRVGFNNFYKKTEAVHRERVNMERPVLMAPNHQNALMDALSVLFNIPLQTVFLARSDIFKGNFVIKLLTFFKILPIYRIRDGAEKLKKNEEIFQLTLQILKNKQTPLCIMPEGNHGDKRRLRNLVKGVFRIAFMAQKEYGTNPGVQLMPVGLDYSNYQKFGQTLLVNYGEPIEVCEYYEEFLQNEPVAINKLKERLANEMKKYMIHIESEEYYDSYMMLRTIYNSNMREHLGIKGNSIYDKFKADKEMIRILDIDSLQEKTQPIHKDVIEYSKVMEDNNLRDWVFKKSKYSFAGILGSFLLLILGFPFYLLGLVNNYIPYKIPTFFTKNIKDPQFHSSFKYAIGVISFLLYYIILLVLALIFLHPWWLKIAYLVLLQPSGVFAYRYYIFVKKWNAKIRYNRAMRRKNKDVIRMFEVRKNIVSAMDGLVREALSKN